MARKTIKVEGMHCQNCASRLEKIINNVDGLSGKVDFESKTAVVESDSDIDENELKNMIDFAGYKVIEIK